MRHKCLQRGALLVLFALVPLMMIGCTDEFYLSEKEAAAYAYVLETQDSADMYFFDVQGQRLDVDFNMVGNTPQISSSNLVTVMRATDLSILEVGPAEISLDRLSGELEREIGNWIAGRMQIYTGDSNSAVRLTDLERVSVEFKSHPTFTYSHERQSIAFDLTITLSIDATIQVNALDAFLDFFFNVNGTYPLTVRIDDLRLQGEASILSPFPDAGRVRFKLTPQLTPITVAGFTVYPIWITDRNNSNAPDDIKNGIGNLLVHNITRTVDEVFYQKYQYFALTAMGLKPGAGQTPTSLKLTYVPRPESARPTLHLVARKTDGKLYHSRKIGSSWTEFRNSLFPTRTFQSDPTLIASGGDQMEVAATTPAGDVVYAHWRDEAWGNQRTIPPRSSSPTDGYRGKPAMVATAPGQVEIVVEGTDNGLWHHRRTNGAWQAPISVPVKLSSLDVVSARNPVLVHTGNKIVLIFVANSNRLRGVAFDLETNVWGMPVTIASPESINHAPAAVASGDGRVDVVYVAFGGAPHHKRLDISATQLVQGNGVSGITVQPGLFIGSTVSDTPVLTCSGYRQLDLIGRGADNRLKYNHFANPLVWNNGTVEGRPISAEWQGWETLNGRFFGSTLPTNEAMDEFAAVATRSGQVELVARGRTGGGTPPAEQLLYHNNFISMRYGRDRWKAVQWRGFDRLNTEKFVGRPALAASDQNFEMAYIGPGQEYGASPSHTLVPEINRTTFLPHANTQVQSFPNPIDPVVLSSGPGIVDIIVRGDDGRPRHLRRINRDPGFTLGHTLSVPQGITLISQLAAVSYGNGWLDVVATGSNQLIYHWRFQNGSWSTAAPLVGTVISSPVLVHVGASQLELFGVGTDQKVYRWRFLGTGWTARQQLASNFPVDALLFEPASAASWGDGTVDLLVVSRTGGGTTASPGSIFHRRVGPGVETCPPFTMNCPFPRNFNYIGGPTVETPALTIFSSTSFNVLAMGSDLKYYSNWAFPRPGLVQNPGGDPPINWSGFALIGGDQLLISNTAQSGRKNVAVTATNRDGRLFINRYQGAGWTGFQPVTGQSTQMQLGPPLFRPALASHGG